jgi:hypothetical protein
MQFAHISGQVTVPLQLQTLRDSAVKVYSTVPNDAEFKRSFKIAGLTVRFQ